MKGMCQCKWCHMRESKNLIITSLLLNFWTVSMRTKQHIVGTCGSERTPKQRRTQYVLPTAIKNPTEERQSKRRRRDNFRRVFGHRTLWTWKRNCVVRGSVKRGYGMQDAEVQGATWTRRRVTSRMSEAGIEKLGATDRIYVSTGGRWCRKRRDPAAASLHHTAILEMSACILHIWIWCTHWYKVHQVAVWLSAWRKRLELSLSVSKDFKSL